MGRHEAGEKIKSNEPIEPGSEGHIRLRKFTEKRRKANPADLATMAMTDFPERDFPAAVTLLARAIVSTGQSMPDLRLGVGSAVLLSANLSTRAGLVNGTDAEVIGFLNYDHGLLFEDFIDEAERTFKASEKVKLKDRAKARKKACKQVKKRNRAASSEGKEEEEELPPKLDRKLPRLSRIEKRERAAKLLEEAVSNGYSAEGTGEPVVKLRDGSLVVIPRMRLYSPPFPLNAMDYSTWESMRDLEQLPRKGESYRMALHYFPLIRSAALTAHKTQGITARCPVVAELSHIFEPGQAYVALSRAPLSRLRIIGDPRIMLGNVVANPDAVLFYKVLAELDAENEDMRALPLADVMARKAVSCL